LSYLNLLRDRNSAAGKHKMLWVSSLPEAPQGAIGHCRGTPDEYRLKDISRYVADALKDPALVAEPLDVVLQRLPILVALYPLLYQGPLSFTVRVNMPLLRLRTFVCVSINAADTLADQIRAGISLPQRIRGLCCST